MSGGLPHPVCGYVHDLASMGGFGNSRSSRGPSEVFQQSSPPPRRRVSLDRGVA